jgi:molybdate transport system permease protein
MSTPPQRPAEAPDVRHGVAAVRGFDWIVPAALPMLLFLLLPLVALLLRVSVRDALDALGGPAAQQAIRLSLTTSLITVVLALLFGTPLAWLLARRRFRGRAWLDALVDLPMVLPPAVAGIALLLAFGRRGLVGEPLSATGIELVFTPAAVILAQLFVAAPFFIRAASTAFAAVQFDLEEAAMLDGASRLQVFRHIILPLTGIGLAGGAVMTWARALGEFGATIIFAGNLPGRTQTMPLAIYLGFEIDMGVALALSTLLLAIAFGVLLVVKWGLHARVQAGQL